MIDLSDDKTRFGLVRYGMRISVGEQYILSIAENPSTGFTWNYPEGFAAATEQYFKTEKTYK